MLKILFNNPLYSSKFNDFSSSIIRICIGLFFLTTGFNKLFVEKNQQIMLETIIHAGIPYPEIMAVFVSLCEFVLGLLLTIGLFTQVSSLILIFICLVALITVGIHTIPPDLNFITWLSWFFYIHDLLYIFILVFLLSKKPDFLAVDRYVFRKYY